MIHVRAPATTANLGAGFDCAGAALDLWNELELHEGGVEADADHLAVRAFARLASPDGFGFTFTDRIPRARGLGSSAATIALGLVAGVVVAGREPDRRSPSFPASGFRQRPHVRRCRRRSRILMRRSASPERHCSAQRSRPAPRSCSPQRPTIASMSLTARRRHRSWPRSASECRTAPSQQRSRARARP